MKKLKLWLALGVVLSVLVGSSASYAYQALELDGSGYASVGDGSQVGLNMGLSDFMVEMRIKYAAAASFQYVISKYGGTGFYIGCWDTEQFYFEINDGSNSAYARSNESYDDGRWHYVVFIADRSSVTGLKIIVDNTELTYSTQQDPTSVLSLDNSVVPFNVGASSVGSTRLTGFFEELRIWNFGKDGLPGDYATYIAWRASARNVFLDISQYDSGSWNGYADADRSELITNGDMEADSTWAPRGSPTTEEQSTDQANNGSNSWKIVSDAGSEGAYQDITTVVGEYYEVTGYAYVTAGDAKVGKEDTDGSDQVLTAQATAAAWNEFNVVFAATETTSRIFFHSDATAASTFYIDDVSVKRIGLVARYKFEGDYTDETTNSNTLTAGGSGNTFPGYTLKRFRMLGIK